MGTFSILQIESLFISLNCTFYYLLDNPFFPYMCSFLTHSFTVVSLNLTKILHIFVLLIVIKIMNSIQSSMQRLDILVHGQKSKV